MTTPPRRLSFAVGTSLLTASLSLGAAACTDAKPPEKPKNDKTEKRRIEIETVNEGPTKEPPVPNVNPGIEPEPDTREVNPGPEVEVPPDPEGTKVNPGPEPAPEPIGAGMNVGPNPDPAKK
jgi:hypothetical protein